MKILSTLFAFSLMFFVVFGTGCSQVSRMMASGGFADYSQDEINKLIVKGKTTQAKVSELFGKPFRVREDKNGTVWTYSTWDKAYKNESVMSSTLWGITSIAGRYAGGIDPGVYDAARTASDVDDVADAASVKEDTELDIYFDKNNIVKNYEWRRVTQ